MEKDNKTPVYIPLFFDTLDTFERLDVEAVGRLTLALLRFGMTGELPEFQTNTPEYFVWPGLQHSAERALGEYAKILSGKRSEAGKKGAAARWGKDSDSTISEISGDAKPERAEYKILGAAKSQELLERFGGIAAV